MMNGGCVPGGMRRKMVWESGQGDVRGFDEDKDFVLRFELHLFDRAGGDNGSDFANARFDDDFTQNFVGDDALNRAGKLISDALFHNAGYRPRYILSNISLES